MTLVGFRDRNHEQQVSARGAIDDVDDRETDPRLWLALHERFGFTIDAAAAPHNAKLPRYFTREQNGLEQPWDTERIWCNPPYSDIEPWIRKALSETAQIVVMLLPANRTEQRWWQRLIEPVRDRPGSRVRVEFLPGRPRFLSPGEGTPRPNSRPPFGVCLLIIDGQAS